MTDKSRFTILVNCFAGDLYHLVITGRRRYTNSLTDLLTRCSSQKCYRVDRSFSASLCMLRSLVQRIRARAPRPWDGISLMLSLFQVWRANLAGRIEFLLDVHSAERYEIQDIADLSIRRESRPRKARASSAIFHTCRGLSLLLVVTIGKLVDDDGQFLLLLSSELWSYCRDI